MSYPSLWFCLDPILARTIRALKEESIHAHTVNSLTMVKQLMWRMEAAVRDEEYNEEKFANLWIFLDIILGNTLRTLQGKPDRYHILLPMALVKWLMKQTEDAEKKGLQNPSKYL